jgi:hypothetical protein
MSRADQTDRTDRLIERLPRAARRASRWLRSSQARLVRVPAGLLLILGGLLFILPFFGLWMVPLGVILLADDIAAFRQPRERMLDVIERYRPHWFTAPAANADERGAPREQGETMDRNERRDWTG